VAEVGNGKLPRLHTGRARLPEELPSLHNRPLDPRLRSHPLTEGWASPSQAPKSEDNEEKKPLIHGWGHVVKKEEEEPEVKKPSTGLAGHSYRGSPLRPIKKTKKEEENYKVNMDQIPRYNGIPGLGLAIKKEEKD
jgi:hypothetical protein